MSIYYLAPSSSAILNPDTNYGTSGSWTNPTNARDGDSGTFCGKNIGGGGPDQDPAIRYRTDYPLTGLQLAVIGVEIEWELTESGALAYWDARLKWQVTPGVTLHDEFLLSNTTRAKAVSRYYLPQGKQQPNDWYTYLTFDVDGPESGTITVKLYEIRFIAVSRHQVAVMEG